MFRFKLSRCCCRFDKFINYYAAVDSQSVASDGVGACTMDERSFWMCQSCGDTHAASSDLDRIRLRFVRNIVRTMYWLNVQVNVLTKWSTVLTTSRLDTWPTSISPMSTANFRLSVIDILTTSSGRFMSLYGGRVKSAIFTDFLRLFILLMLTIWIQLAQLWAQNHQFDSPYQISLNGERTATHTQTHTQCISIFSPCFCCCCHSQWFCMYEFFFMPFIHFIQSPLWRFR